jgi:hypothetical protein
VSGTHPWVFVTTAQVCCKPQAIRALFQCNINSQLGIITVSITRKTLCVVHIPIKPFFKVPVGIIHAHVNLFKFTLPLFKIASQAARILTARGLSGRKTYKRHIREGLPPHAGMAERCHSVAILTCGSAGKI